MEKEIKKLFKTILKGTKSGNLEWKKIYDKFKCNEPYLGNFFVKQVFKYVLKFNIKKNKKKGYEITLFEYKKIKNTNEDFWYKKRNEIKNNINENEYGLKIETYPNKSYNKAMNDCVKEISSKKLKKLAYSINKKWNKKNKLFVLLNLLLEKEM